MTDLDAGSVRGGAMRCDRTRKLVGVLAAVMALGVASLLGYAVGSTTRANLKATIGDVAIEIRPPPKHCAKPKKNCMKSKCCYYAGSHCFTKNETFAGCAETCGAGKTKGWTCTLLSHWDEGETMASVTGPGLFCFEAFMIDAGKPKYPVYDLELVKTQLHTKTSIFGCADWRVFADKAVELSPGNPGPALYTVQVDTPHWEMRKMNGHWINGPQFISIWTHIKKHRLHEPYQWTVKVDADAVFFPQRLTARLADQPVPKKGLYITNCKHSSDAFFGALEVMSRDAVTNFLANLTFCRKTLNWTFPTEVYGEDKFFQRCCEKSGVETAEDLSIIQDNLCAAVYKQRKIAEKQKKKKMTDENLWDLVDIPKCHNTSGIAFHPLPSPDDYFACLEAAQRR